MDDYNSFNDDRIYYLDNYMGYIYNKDGVCVGNISDGYYVNYEDNHLYKDGVDLGALDDINNMGLNNDKSQVKVRTLKNNNNMLGNVNLFIISLILIIGIILSVIVIFLK